MLTAKLSTDPLNGNLHWKLSGAAAAPYSHKHQDLGHSKSGKQSPPRPARSSPLPAAPQAAEKCPRQTLTPPAGMWPGHQAMAGSLMPPSKVVCLPHRKGPLLPPRDRKKAFNLTKHQHFKRTLSPRLAQNEFSFLHGCFFKRHGQSWVFCHCFLVCCVVVLLFVFSFQYPFVMKF